MLQFKKILSTALKVVEILACALRAIAGGLENFSMKGRERL